MEINEDKINPNKNMTLYKEHRGNNQICAIS